MFEDFSYRLLPRTPVNRTVENVDNRARGAYTAG